VEGVNNVRVFAPVNSETNKVKNPTRQVSLDYAGDANRAIVLYSYNSFNRFPIAAHRA
jgi:hypothetical protein